jgi:hypothetical protein
MFIFYLVAPILSAVGFSFVRPTLDYLDSSVGGNGIPQSMYQGLAMDGPA